MLARAILTKKELNKHQKEILHTLATEVFNQRNNLPSNNTPQDYEIQQIIEEILSPQL